MTITEKPTAVDEVHRADGARELVEATWSQIGRQFEAARIADDTMQRTEMGFHDHVRLLGYLALAMRDEPGDVVEIGVWKGRSLTLMARLSGPATRVVGVDPFELPGQANVVAQLHQRFFPSCLLIPAYSQDAVTRVADATDGIKLLHVDGGHLRGHVWADFLLYERLVRPGGWIVFDDYGDTVHSPEVGPAVDELEARGWFAGYEVHGPVAQYAGKNYALRKRAA